MRRRPLHLPLTLLLAATASCAVSSPATLPPVSPAPVSAVAPDPVGALEPGMNRNGSDYFDFNLKEARPEICRDACLADARCAAFTYVNPNVQGPNARCWLKNPAPPAQPDACCASGVNPGFSPSAGPQVVDGMELRTNRGGGDYTDMALKEARPELCRDACRRDPKCAAFTYVNPNVQGPDARCWLKSTVPAPTHDLNCVSGTK